MPAITAIAKNDAKILRSLRVILRNQGIRSFDPQSDEGKFVYSMFKDFKEGIKGDFDDNQREILAEMAVTAVLLFRMAAGHMLRAGAIAKKDDPASDARRKAFQLAKGLHKQGFDQLVAFMKITHQAETPGTGATAAELIAEMARVHHAREITDESVREDEGKNK